MHKLETIYNSTTTAGTTVMTYLKDGKPLGKVYVHREKFSFYYEAIKKRETKPKLLFNLDEVTTFLKGTNHEHYALPFN